MRKINVLFFHIVSKGRAATLGALRDMWGTMGPLVGRITPPNYNPIQYLLMKHRTEVKGP